MNHKLGYYTVDGLVFTEKIQAMLHVSKTKTPVSWNFHHEVYSKLDWTKEPETSLDSFYQLRAQQIREQYDYIVLMCSGGGDSTNVIYSFLRNGIKVDEIVASAPVSGLNRWRASADQANTENTISETVLAQMPLLAEIHSLYPEVKITVNDYFDTILNYNTDDWIFRSGEWIHPSTAARYDLSGLEHLVRLADAGKKIGIVYGIDKPFLVKTAQGTLALVISDLAVNVQRPAFRDHYHNVENVLFYYTPDMPLMQVKQAHQVARWIHQPENKLALDNVRDYSKSQPNWMTMRLMFSTYERAIMPCIYPSTHRAVFQGHKPISMFLAEHDAWFYRLHYNSRAYQLINSDFSNFIKSINPEMLNPGRVGFKVFTQEYELGPVSKFAPLVL